MAYFSNGSEGESYHAHYCARCIHEPRCAVWLLHLLHNYRDCNNPDSMLHTLIPRNQDGSNGKCTMFATAEQVKRIRHGADKQQTLALES